MRPFSNVLATGDSNAAGFPCTSPRLLKGAGDQGVFSDVGKVCCDTSSSGGWRGAGADSLQKTIDVSQVSAVTIFCVYGAVVVTALFHRFSA